MAKAGRPKGSGLGLVTMGLRIEPEIYDLLHQYAGAHHMTPASAARFLMRVALEQKETPSPDAGYLEGLRQGRGDFHRVLNEVWEKLSP